MSSEIAISTRDLGKAYQIYRKPIDRLKQMAFRGRRRFYEEFWALRDITVEVHQGETVGIIGRNGSGKSTFLQIVCGTLQPTTGQLYVGGRIAALLELGAGFNPEFTGRENVYLAASVLGLTRDEIDARYQSIEAFAGIGDFVDQPVKTYSSGMYARLAFAVAAHVDADVLIVDEILSVGDAAFTQKCMSFIRAFKEKGTIFFVSHDSSAVVNLCDRVIWLDCGTVREIGAPNEVCQNYLASIQAEKDDSRTFRFGGQRKRERLSSTAAGDVVRDPRHELLKNSNVRNVIEPFEFDPDARWFGRGGAQISSVQFLDDQGNPLVSFVGGEVVNLRIAVQVMAHLASPIVGFYVKDRLGQYLFGDNTYLSYHTQSIDADPGDELVATFRFSMPYFPPGDYSISPAVAEGNQEDHLQQQWLDDALFFKVLASHINRGLVGLPMLEIRFERNGTQQGQAA